jgi:hypothetical protein
MTETPSTDADSHLPGIDTTVAHPARIYDYYLVRHEALFDRAGWEALPMTCRSRLFEAEGSLALEAQSWVGAALTKPGRAGTARRLGLGERDGEVYGKGTSYGTPFRVRTGSNLVDVGRAAVHALVWGRLLDRFKVDRSGGHGECLRRSRGEAAGEQLGADPVERSMVNVGTTVGSPSCPVSQAGQRVCTPSVDGSMVGRSLRSSPSTGKPCTWRRETASPQSWGCQGRRHR